MIFFTSDLHLGHENCIRLCNRPFSSIEEMDETLIENWNRKVTGKDTVYILGDLIYRNQKPPEEYLRRLRGKKHLILGNHDRGWIRSCQTEQFFESVNNLLYVADGKRQYTLCHYPMMSWPHIMRCYMVFGHIHGNTDADYWPLIQANERMLNAGVDVNHFEPVTFEEMEANNLLYKGQSKAGLDGASRAERSLSPVPKRKRRGAVLRENPRSHFRWRAAAYRSGGDPVQSGAAHLYARHSCRIYLPEPEPSGCGCPFRRRSKDQRTFEPIWRAGAIPASVARLKPSAYIWQNQRRR